MKINLDKMILSLSYPEELEEFKYFKQFNVCETVDCRDYIHVRNNGFRRGYSANQELEISNLETTAPILNLASIKVIDTIEGTSVEGEHSTGKKLIVVGEINLSLIITYFIGCSRYNNIVIDMNIPFSTFIIIPKDISSDDRVNLRYLIEDLSVENLSKNRVIVSATILMQYLDEY